MERQVPEKTIKYIHPSYPLTEEETEVIRQCQYIRRKVFIEGQNVDEHIELDGKDQQFDHLLLYYGGTPAGCLRINTSSNSRVKLERLAVLHAYRNLGLGTSLLHKAIALCLEQGNENIIMHAQYYLLDYYRRLGFSPIGRPFFEAEIKHIKMYYIGI